MSISGADASGASRSCTVLADAYASWLHCEAEASCSPGDAVAGRRCGNLVIVQLGRSCAASTCHADFSAVRFLDATLRLATLLLALRSKLCRCGFGATMAGGSVLTASGVLGLATDRSSMPVKAPMLRADTCLDLPVD
jgi:hypothetical protein